MSSAAVGTHSGAGPLGLMSCVRESSPLQDFDSDSEKNVASKRRFWNPKKWFKRKSKPPEDVIPIEVTEIGKDALRSRSTSELSVTEDSRRRSSSSMHPGLSVSHDSVFHSPNSGSDMELDAAQSSSSLSISQPLVDLRLQTELSERLRLRRGRGDTSEDDEGLPHSPCNSPTTSDGLLLDKTAIKDLPTKSHSTCSDGSLLSMGSYEDEDSFGPQSRFSSKLSLQEKKSNPDSDLEFGTSSTVAPLNHSAAHHRVSIKPKKTHGAPRRKRGQQLSSALPVTPEVNEESSVRSTSPEISRKETLTELYRMNSTRTFTETQLKCSSLPSGLAGPGSETTKLNRSKSNAGSKSQDHFSPLHEDCEKEEKPSLLERIFPRKSGRKKKSKEEKEAHSRHETRVVKQEIVLKHEEKNKHEEFIKEKIVADSSVNSFASKTYTENSTILTSVSGKYEPSHSKPLAAPRSGAAARQRMTPIDIPATPEEVRRESSGLPKSSPEKSLAGTSPLQTELENIFKHRQITLSTSPPKPAPKLLESPPQSPKSPKSTRNVILPPVISSVTEFNHYTKTSNITKHVETRSRSEEIRNKMKIPGLSSLQQRVLSLNDDDTDSGFKSLTEFTNTDIKPAKAITKSHSFKSAKQRFDAENREVSVRATTADFLLGERKDENRMSFTKAASLDSIKTFEEPTHQSVFKFDLKPIKRDTTKTSHSVVGDKTEGAEKKNDIARDLDVFMDSITISGPSHTAVVNVTSNSEDFTTNTSTSNSTESGVVEKEGSKTISFKESQVSVTKIQLKRETTQVTQSTISIPKTSVPEFLHKQLNKVEIKPSSNLIFSMKSPRVVEEPNRPKTLFNFDGEPEIIAKPPAPRKFSKENLEIIENNDKEDNLEQSPKTPPVITVGSLGSQPIRFKKNEKNTSRKSSVISITPDSPIKEKTLYKSKSVSLDSLKSEVNESDQSSQDSLDKLEEKHKEKSGAVSETVVLRKKSLANKNNDDEPELMKVFARRSLKLKDSDVESIQESLADNKTRDSDKENQVDSPVDDRKKWYNSKPKESHNETEPPQKRKSLVKVESVELKSPIKEPLADSKIADPAKNKSKDALPESPVALRRTVNNNIFINQRAVSLNPPKTVTSELLVRKQSSFTERRRTDQWITNKKNEDTELKEKIQDDIISTDFITEPKNFNQRKAEWEKRAQQAQKKTTP